MVVEWWGVPQLNRPARKLGDSLDVVLGFDAGGVGRGGERQG